MLNKTVIDDPGDKSRIVTGCDKFVDTRNNEVFMMFRVDIDTLKLLSLKTCNRNNDDENFVGKTIAQVIENRFEVAGAKLRFFEAGTITFSE